MTTTIGFIGAGNMATSVIGGLIKSGFPAHKIYAHAPNLNKLASLAARVGLNACQSNAELVQKSKVVVLAIKPQVMQSVLSPLIESFANTQPLIISVVAGIRASSIHRWLNFEHAVVRVMPNTPALVGCGASGLFATENVTSAQKAQAEHLMNSVGICEWVTQESDIDSVTALSGSGPAYFMLFIQALANAASEAGLNPDAALRLATQTAAGAAELIKQSDETLTTLIDNVTSPGGTTEQGLIALNDAQLQDVVSQAFNAAKRRSEELASKLG